MVARTVERLTQFAISATAIWSACYLISVILHPRQPANRTDFLIGILALEFVELHGVNLTAVATIVSSVSIFRIIRAQNKGERTQPILLSSISLFILATALLMFLPEWTVTPVAQFSGRGLPVLGTTVLSLGLWAGCRSGMKPEFLLSKPVLLVLFGLLLTQSVAQIMMTRQWANTLGTVMGIIERREGRVPWQTALETAAPRNPVLWKEMTWYSEIEALSLLLAPQGRVHALIDAPTSERWKPLRLDAPTEFPEIEVLGRHRLPDCGRKPKPTRCAISRAANSRGLEIVQRGLRRPSESGCHLLPRFRSHPHRVE